MVRFLSLSNFLLFLCLCLNSCGKANTVPFSYYENYCIVDQSDDNPTDRKWTDYLVRHLSKRCLQKSLVSRNFTNSDNNVKITVHVDTDMDSDYSISRKRTSISLQARDADIMLWLIYQFIAGVADDDGRFDATDIPPAVIDIESQQADRAFELRSIYSLTNSDGEMLSIRGTNHVDYDWGLWGHNLWKVVGDNDSEELYALVSGKRDHSQYCFSSPQLQSIIESWIIDNYGDGAKSPSSFTIMPQDNSLVCMCDRCRKAGNTAGNATPAVTALLTRLAEKYPRHRFFTSAYLTTNTPPAKKLPSNVGVFISAIDLPMSSSFAASAGGKAFDSLVKSWKGICDRVYVWDYMQNFDDYLTPYPCLTVMQKRLQYFRSSGVRGIFLNGSGDAYSSFDDLHTFVASALLVNPDADVKKLTRRFFAHYYPSTYDILTEYYLSLEDRAKSSSAALPLYDGIAKSASIYLDASAFEKFWTALDKASKNVTGSERSRLNYLLTALCYTRLELLRMHPEKIDKNTLADVISVLSGYKEVPGLQQYRESDGQMSAYLEQWNSHPVVIDGADRLKGTAVTSNNLGEDALGADVLTDGKLGFATDYHLHWLISDAKEWQLTISRIPASEGTLRLSILFAPQWRMWYPESIEIVQGGKTISVSTYQSPSEDRSVFIREAIDVPLKNVDTSQPLLIKIRNSSRRRSTIACDEIAFYL